MIGWAWTKQMRDDANCSPGLNDWTRSHMMASLQNDRERERDLAMLRHAEALAKALREKLGLPSASEQEAKRAERARHSRVRVD